jgi:ABC-type antimicrobial peptide transport system permease subunit
MLKSYLLVTFRNLVKNRVFTLINIIGLGIALAVCIVAFFNHMFNHEFDRTHENFDSIYRVTCFRDMQGREQEYGIIPATLGLEVKKDIPGIDRSARLARSGSPVKEGLDVFPTQISYVDPEFLDIFTFPIQIGEKKAIEDQGNILVSSKMAATLFGSEYPIGKSISVVDGKNREHTYTVGAVFSDLPENSSFRIDILTHFDNFLLMWDVKDSDWKFWMACFFIQVNDKSLLPSINQSLKQYLPVQNKAREDFIVNRYSLVPLDDVGENSRTIWSSSLFPSLHPAALIAPPVMAIFILLIACFNFANTSISTFSKRLKEIGLRKTFGGQRRQLVSQFMLETFIICLLALFVGILIAEFLVPAYSSLWAYMSIEMTLTKYTFFYVFLLLLLLGTGFIAGVYPAIYVSSFSPVYVLKGASPFRGSGKLSSVLLALQFSISVMAIVMGIVFAKNAEFQKTLDLGYDRDKTIIVPVPRAYFNTLRNEVISNPKVISAEGSSNHIGWGSYRRPIKDNDKQLEVDVMDIGHSYAQTMGLRLSDGRLFDELREAADYANGSIIVNKKLVNDFGWKDPVGRTVTLYDTTKLIVIGVVEDFYLGGVWQAVEPAMLRIIPPERFGLLAVRANPEDLASVLEDISLKWKNLKTNSVFGGRLQEDMMQEEKDINGSIMKVNIFLAVVATLLSLIGMYNLVSLDIIKRTKEMGIRKIQGAPVPVIMFLVSKKFIFVLLIASLLGCLGGYYMSNMLMDSIWDYYVDITAGMLLFSASVMIIATSITVVFKITRAALKNPVVSLRYE